MLLNYIQVQTLGQIPQKIGGRQQDALTHIPKLSPIALKYLVRTLQHTLRVRKKRSEISVSIKVRQLSLLYPCRVIIAGSFQTHVHPVSQQDPKRG